MLERVEWLYVRRWEQPFFMLLQERVFERLEWLVFRLLKWVDCFIENSRSGGICLGHVSLVEAMEKWRVNGRIDKALTDRELGRRVEW